MATDPSLTGPSPTGPSPTGPSPTDPSPGAAVADQRADLQRARCALLEAELTDDVVERHRRAHLAALRVAAVVLSLRARRCGGASRPRNAWRLLAQVAPEYAEWAGYFHAVQARQRVSSRESEDLVRDAGRFLDLIERRLEVGVRYGGLGRGVEGRRHG